MSKERYLNTKFWDDNYIVNKDPIEKLLFIYLLTNPLTNLIGIYEISLKRIAFDTGIDNDMVSKILERFEKDNKIKYFKGYVALKNFTKHQKNNPKINKGIEILTREVPSELLEWVNIDRKRFDIIDDLTQFNIAYDSLSHPNPNSNINSNSNSNINNIYTYWNNQKIIVHRNIDKYKSTIKTVLKNYSEEELITAITNYKIILSSEDYILDKKWELNEFLRRKIDRFLDLEAAKSFYKNYKKGDYNGKSKGYNKRDTSGTEEHGGSGEDKYKHLEETYEV